MHAEMFPLLKPDADNPLELFQIWLNLPPQSKMVPAYFGMLWSENIPTISAGPGVSVDVIAGPIEGAIPPSPPPDSWASQAGSHLGIWLIRLDSDATYDLPLSPGGVNRMLHFFAGSEASVAGSAITRGTGVRLQADGRTNIVNTGVPAEFLLLQGEPIGAPVFQMGPFVMNTMEELQQAVDDYRRTQFGGWPWSTPSPVHPRGDGRFALHADGTVEQREMQPTL
jgi:hypothetical protein